MPALPRPLLLVAGLAGMAVLAVVTFASFRAVQPTIGGAGAPVCSPHPCTELGGWELYVSNVQHTGERLTLMVRFRNNTAPGGAEAVSYRHSNPADFILHAATGAEFKPVSGPGCPSWDETRIERGGGAGPDVLCFDTPTRLAPGSQLRWTPDQGLFSATGSVPLRVP